MNLVPAYAKAPNTGDIAEPQMIVDSVVDTYRSWTCNTTASHNKSYCRPTYKTISYRVRYDRTGPYFVRNENGVGECTSGHRGVYTIWRYEYKLVN